MPLPTLSLAEASCALRDGKLVVFPTETFYAIGCNALDPDAVGRIFSAKKRALTMPLPVVVASMEQLSQIALFIPDTAASLMHIFWPGPLSIVLPARPEVPDLLTANAGRIAVRYSPHPAVLRLCEQTKLILVASSANISGVPSVALAKDLDEELVQHAAGVYDVLPAPEGKESSTVVDVVEGAQGSIVRILRSGAVTREAMEHAGFTVE